MDTLPVETITKIFNILDLPLDQRAKLRSLSRRIKEGIENGLKNVTHIHLTCLYFPHDLHEKYVKCSINGIDSSFWHFVNNYCGKFINIRADGSLNFSEMKVIGSKLKTMHLNEFTDLQRTLTYKNLNQIRECFTQVEDLRIRDFHTCPENSSTKKGIKKTESIFHLPISCPNPNECWFSHNLNSSAINSLNTYPCFGVPIAIIRPKVESELVELTITSEVTFRKLQNDFACLKKLTIFQVEKPSFHALSIIEIYNKFYHVLDQLQTFQLFILFRLPFYEELYEYLKFLTNVKYVRIFVSLNVIKNFEKYHKIELFSPHLENLNIEVRHKLDLSVTSKKLTLLYVKAESLNNLIIDPSNLTSLIIEQTNIYCDLSPLMNGSFKLSHLEIRDCEFDDVSLKFFFSHLNQLVSLKSFVFYHSVLPKNVRKSNHFQINLTSPRLSILKIKCSHKLSIKIESKIVKQVKIEANSIKELKMDSSSLKTCKIKQRNVLFDTYNLSNRATKLKSHIITSSKFVANVLRSIFRNLK